MGLHSGKNRAAHSRRICNVGNYEPDPHGLAVAERPTKGKKEARRRKSYYEKTKKKSFQKFVLIEKLATLELAGRSFFRPVPKKMGKFHQEIRGNVVFLISLPIWKKHEEEVMKIIEEHIARAA